MSNPLVSIVVNNYNYGRYVGAAIQSALDQSYPHCQVIVVDDGSTDESRQVIEGFGERVTALFQANGGQCVAFNTAFAACRGDIVLFLDSDDALRPEAVAEIVKVWRPGLAKVQFCLASVDAGGRFIGSVYPNYPPDLTPARIRRELLRTALYPCPPTSGNAYARDFLAQIMPLPTHGFRGADGAVNTVAPLYGDVLTLDRVLAYYRIHGGNSWAQAAPDLERFADYIRHDQMRLAYLREHAEKRGVRLAADPLGQAMLHMQYRLVSRRLAPTRHPVPGETVPGLALRALRATVQSGERLPSRALIAGWIAAFAIAPRGLAGRLVSLRFAPGQRPQYLRNLLRSLRILRPPELDTDLANMPPRLRGAVK